MRYPPNCPPLRLLTNTSNGTASSGSNAGSIDEIPVYSPLRFFRESFLATFFVKRVNGLRMGASVTHSGGRIKRACFDCCSV
jgi:hypothetical protein